MCICKSGKSLRLTSHRANKMVSIAILRQRFHLSYPSLLAPLDHSPSHILTRTSSFPVHAQILPTCRFSANSTFSPTELAAQAPSATLSLELRRSISALLATAQAHSRQAVSVLFTSINKTCLLSKACRTCAPPATPFRSPRSSRTTSTR